MIRSPQFNGIYRRGRVLGCFAPDGAASAEPRGRIAGTVPFKHVTGQIQHVYEGDTDQDFGSGVFEYRVSSLFQLKGR